MVEIIVSVVIEVAKCLAPSTERQFSYVRDYKSNFENLKTQVEKLEGEIGSMQHAVDEAKRKGEEIEHNVQNWLARANKAIVEAKKFVGDEATANNRCFMGLCPNLKTRYRLSKEAVRQLDAIVKLGEVTRFERISYSIIPEDDLLMSNKDYEAFESRMSTLNNILGALKNPDVNMLGIYGMGGIGKTTLAKEVARKAENEKLFYQVLFTEVSQSPDIRKIQGEIADKLGLKFNEESESGRARSLWSRLKKEKRILVILDNIWDYLDLRAVGIPHGDDHKGCKVLLTARSLDVLSGKMDSQQNFTVGILKEEEAWSLFKKMAGDYIEGSEFQSVAREVANECAGLPVSIVTVARALRNKRLFEWKDALEQVRRPSSTNFKDIQPTAYKAIELSYNKLEGEELKNTFLLIGYTAIASIDDLLMYGTGLGLFQGVHKMEVARARVSSLVYKLKASCMLLEEDISMHDVVRDVAISIASRDQNVFTATGELVDSSWEWSDESAAKLYTSIVLLDVKTNMLPQVLECPQLKLFSMRASGRYSSMAIPDNFFTRMIQVRVMVLTNMRLSPLCSSLGLLKNLRTLCLYNCELLLDLSIIGDLKKLEILCLNDFEIMELPVEVGELTRLRILDLRYCWQLEVIPPNVLSNLSQLEELYIGDSSFYQWEVEVKGVKNASLQELKHLPNLTSLELEIPDVNTLPRGLFFRKLERFKIHLGYWFSEHSNNCCREFRLRLNTKIRLKDGLMVQLQGIEDLELWELQEQDVDYFVSELVKVGSSNLKHLRMDGCHEAPNPEESKRQEESTNDIRLNEIVLEDNISMFNSLFIEKVSLPKLQTLYLDSINIERIWQNQVTALSCGISNLTRLILYNCRNLRYLFSSSIVSRFVRLQHLLIYKSPVLEEIIVVDDQEETSKINNNIVMFPRLRSLKMVSLEKLTSFCTRDLHIMEFPSLKELDIRGCPDQFMANFRSTTNDLKKKVFPNLEELRVDAKHIVAKKSLFSGDLLCKLKCLDVAFDESTTILSLDDFLQRIHTTMEGLYIGGGPLYLRESKEMVENGMEVIIRGVDKCCDLKHILKQQTNSSIMDNLEILELWDCDHLINLVPSLTSFQNLTTLKVSYCQGLTNVFTSSTAKSLVHLIEMSISGCEMIIEIVADDDDEAKDEAIVFSKLMILELNDLRSLTSFCSGSRAFEFPSLERLLVEYCPNMNIFSGGELSTLKLRSVELGWDEKRLAGPDDLNTAIQQLYLKRMEDDKEEDSDSDDSTEVEDEEEDAQSRDNW